MQMNSSSQKGKHSVFSKERVKKLEHTDDMADTFY